jgi:hypothetical protein
MLKKRVCLTFTVLYVLYLTKTALGINISEKYTAPGIFKFPLRAMSKSIVLAKKTLLHIR